MTKSTTKFRSLLILLLAGALGATTTSVSPEIAARANTYSLIVYHVKADQRVKKEHRIGVGSVHGIGATIDIAEPQRQSKTWSLAQLFIGDDRGLGYGNAIEFGWATDDSNDGRPHLFLVVRYVNDYTAHTITKDGDYGFHANTAEGTPDPNADISEAIGTAQLFHVGYYNADHSWWVQYKDKWLGRIDGGTFPNPHTWPNPVGFYPLGQGEARDLEWYGEVGNDDGITAPCTEMGNGTSPNAAHFTGMFYEVAGAASQTEASATMQPYDFPDFSGSQPWSVSPPPGTENVNQFSFGGGGYCAGAR